RRAHGERVRPDEEGLRAVTYYSIVEQAWRPAAWLALMPTTGRTPQLRAHCVALGTPILGDGKYGGEESFISGADLPKQLPLHPPSTPLPRPGGGGLPPPPHPFPAPGGGRHRAPRPPPTQYPHALEILRLQFPPGRRAARRRRAL